MTLNEVSERTKFFDPNPKKKGVSESTIQRLESGTRDNPKLDSVVMMAKALGENSINKFINWEAFKQDKNEVH